MTIEQGTGALDADGLDPQGPDPQPTTAPRGNLPERRPSSLVPDADAPDEVIDLARSAAATDTTPPPSHRPATRHRYQFVTTVIRRARDAVVARFRRLRSAGRLLRIVPFIVAALTGLTVNITGRQLADRASRAYGDKVWSDLNTDASNRFSNGYRALAGGPRPDDGYLWLINGKGEIVDHFGNADFTPPLADFATRAREDGGRTDQWLNYFGDRRAQVERLDGDRIMVLMQDTGWVGSNIDAQRSRNDRRVWYASIISALMSGGLAFAAVRPLRRTLAERRDFLADAAHEMRTPLAIIRASASHALARPRSGEEYVRSLAEIRSAAERAGSGVTELLDLARFESGQAVPRLAPLRLDLLAEEVVAASRYDGVDLVHEVGPSVLVDADLALLRQAIDNLVRNAAARGHEVVVRARVEGRDGVLDVLDDGPGFAPDQIPYVFERFRRADRSGSTGLGLAIVAAITAAHGGTAQAANRPEGGACVTLRIPRSRA
jgi:signal transduction histidine kinase